MTEDLEALVAFNVVEKPQDLGYSTPYMKIGRACKNLANDKALALPLTFFKSKNYRPSIANAGKRLGIKLKSCVKEQTVYIWKV